MAKITINNINLEANEGEYILEVARKNNIFIPAICYLSKCSPTLACKLCMVDVDGKRTYACNTKIKDGMNIITSTKEIESERKDIMKSYVVNHPLECGVCDKSGECELQDYTLLMGVNSQNLFVSPSFNTFASWSHVKYDPSLCILCERCVTTCKDNLGESNIKAVKVDSPALDAAYWKERMPKDAFSVWNRKQKSIIGFVGENPCIDCSECVSVCPVGALGVKSFQYTSNAWELNKVSSTCNLCPSGCKIVYEGKKDSKNKYHIYRVTNDFNFNPICGAGRFAYDISPKLDLNNFDVAIDAIKRAKNIIVGGNVTNNEAKFLALLKNNLGVKLVNNILKQYKDFISIYYGSGAKNTMLKDISNYKVIVSIGSSLKNENPLLRYKINNTLKLKKDSSFIYIHPFSDKLISKLSKNVTTINLATNSDDAAILAILKILDCNNPLLKVLEDSKININHKMTQDDEEKNINVEYYDLFMNAKLDYETFLNLESKLSSKPLIVIGSDLYAHPNATYLAKILASLQIEDKIDVIFIPPSPNANGICNTIDFDDEVDGYRLGFRAKGDYVFDSVSYDFALPYFSQLEDSITNIDYKTLPLYPINNKIDYLEQLGRYLGFDFESDKITLNNKYGNDGADLRGITIAPRISYYIDDIKFVKIDYVDSNAYMRDFGVHFYPYTKYSKNLDYNVGIYVSKEYLEKLNCNEGDIIKIESEYGKIEANIYIDVDMDGEYFAISPQINNADKFFGKTKYIKAGVLL
ncbi:NADH-quinone oxidoreductase subunit G [Helicobacter sp. MIT 99-5507]|uniref:NADH-quinone oxidoreductase subunit G n=1 Tax=Helicobacter sp. MIT 99-5507 TaxID=152489 RepID=UPI000E1F5308|nr:NADH-quinone oxidoreductase subunit G [Helicobacter sp. MIT 99-5507]RDU57384.1 NADH-quinone oxidoreductase subunit G [Helicobacter sp. MIT 99-5507]